MITWSELEARGIKPYYKDDAVFIVHGDCREVLLSGISAVATDPPYELGFMGKEWDSKGVSFQKETWAKIRSYCLPGAPLLSFGGTRTQHRIVVAIEDGGWEIRDCIMWVYGSGFPKSLNISKAIDKVNGQPNPTNEFKNYLKEAKRRSGLTSAQIDIQLNSSGSGIFSQHYTGDNPQIVYPTKEKYQLLKKLLGLDNSFDYLIEWAEAKREVIKIEGKQKSALCWGNNYGDRKEIDFTIPATPEAKLWEGYGTALKPAYEPIILAMNPLDGTFAENALKHGVAGLNIDECRIPAGEDDNLARENKGKECLSWGGTYGAGDNQAEQRRKLGLPPQGRFPANFIHDGSQEVMELFPETGISKGGQSGVKKSGLTYSANWDEKQNYQGCGFGDSGSAARFFYTPKASRSERGEGNSHVAVKPLALMEYLVKLVKMPEYNLILDPFMGSGTTLLACIKLGIPCIGIDTDEKSCAIAAQRCSQAVMNLEVEPVTRNRQMGLV